MRSILEKTRAILVTGLVGAGLGALLGGVIIGVLELAAPGLFGLLGIGLGAGVMASFGGFAGVGFAVLMAASERYGSVQDVPTWRVAGLGFVAGALFPGIIALGSAGAILPLTTELVSICALFGLMGGGLSTGLVAVAKHEDSGTLESSVEEPRLPAGDDGEGEAAP